MITIKEGAIFIADSHYPHHGNEFLTLLQKIYSKEINASQLFLMGDNFDLLFGYNDYIQTFSKEAIELLKKLSFKLDIYYFEGNHDFELKPIFTNIKIYSRDEQPISFTLGSQKVSMSHGDKFVTGTGYDLYCKVIRNKWLIVLLRPLEILIINDRMKKLSVKNICHTFVGFEKRVEQIMNNYKDADIVVEGHFHQARVVGKYISLPSLACQGEVGVVEDSKIVFKKL